MDRDVVAPIILQPKESQSKIWLPSLAICTLTQMKKSERAKDNAPGDECERVKQQLEMLAKDLGQSMVDCLKKGDQQLEQGLVDGRAKKSE